MTKAFIFSFNKEVSIPNEGLQKQKIFVLFFPYKDLQNDKTDIQIQLRNYFHKNTLPDRLIIICFKFNEDDVIKLFSEHSEIYDYIPKFKYTNNQNSIHAISLQENRSFKTILGSKLTDAEIKEVYNRGLVKIFNENGGLIVAQSAHHFVFPSGKHCDRFLRTGNVLIQGTQILFIASALIKHFKKQTIISYIYCDTSSINSIAYSFIGLLRDLNPKLTESIHVESFGSYEMFEKGKFLGKKNSIFFISSSTSGSILDRMIAGKKGNILLDDIAVIYGLKVKAAHLSRVVCDLTLDQKSNPEGIEEFKSDNVGKGEECKFCISGSKPIKVEGDVFLLEKPVISGHLIKTIHAPKFLKDLANFYKKGNSSDKPIFKCYHKEMSSDKKYEIFVDVNRILQNWENRSNPDHLYADLNLKLEKYILQNIPASVKYMVVLPDEASQSLAKIIGSVLREQGVKFDNKNIIGITSTDLQKINPTDKGVVAVISSSVVTGSNLLYLSRALRDFSNYQRIFFNYVSRTSNTQHFDFLRSNLGLGEFGIDSHKIFNVETIFCSSEARFTPWHEEEDFVLTLQEFFEETNDYKSIQEYCVKRIEELANSGKYKGLDNNLFFPSLKNKPLTIRNGFAFSPYLKGKEHDEFINHSSQSEVFFIMSSILNDLRNRNILSQSQYVRNVIEPGNFVRFNDGIIQASILRATTVDELNYSLSDEMSLQIKSILGDMILHIDDDHAEALNEFFYAISIKKLRLTNEVLLDCISLLKLQQFYNNNDCILKGLVYYIESKILTERDVVNEFKELSLHTKKSSYQSD